MIQTCGKIRGLRALGAAKKLTVVGGTAVARFQAVGTLAPPVLYKRSLNTILPTSSGTARQSRTVWSVLLVTMLCFAPLGAPAQTLNPASLSFGNWPVQTTSTAENVTLTNTLSSPLTINSISPSGDFAESSTTCPLAPNTLAAGANCTISLTFTPLVLGSLSGTLTVDDNSSTSPQTTQLTGTGVAPIVLQPSSLNFGNQTVNTTSAAKNFTLWNYQTTPLAISAMGTSGNFAQTSTCPVSPNTLAARSSCTISVTFTPESSGSLTGTLTVTDNASNSPQTSSLSGTGTLPVSLAPSSLTFGPQILTTTSLPGNITLNNATTSALTISSISTSGNFAQTSTCPLSPNTLAAGANCPISVTFTPTTVGTLTGTLTIVDNASTSPQTAALSGTGSLTSLNSMGITPTYPSIAVGQQLQLTATGYWRSGLSLNITPYVTWSSSASSIASVSSTGVVQGTGQGVATISASYGTVSASTTITVGPPVPASITVIPGNPGVPAGAYEQFAATVNYSDGSTKDATSLSTWSSSAAAVATISNSGLAAALTAGSTTITATLGSVNGSTTLSVSTPQCVNPPPGLIGWWTGDGNTVDIAGSNSGTLQSGATYGNGEVAQAFSFGGNGASVWVNSTVYSPTAGTLMFWFLANGVGPEFLTGGFAGGQNRAPGFSLDSGDNLDWEFANLHAQPVGQVDPNQWNHAALTYSTANAETSVNVYLNGVLVADALTDANTSWNPRVAFGAYLGIQEPSFTGSLDEIAIFNQALSATQIQQVYNAFSAGMCKPTLQSITVNPPTPSVPVGFTLQFDAVGSYSDSSMHDVTTSATWASSNTAAATVSAAGMATGVASGSTTISATLGSAEGSTTVNVGPTLVSIQVTPQNPSLDVGATLQLTATGTFSDGTQQNLTAKVRWSTSAAMMATVSSGGLVTGVGAGPATITATSGPVSGSTQVTVNSATLSSIAISPANPAAIAIGLTQQFTATGTFSDGTQQNLTATVSWSSSATGVAKIASSGVATAVSAGVTTITAMMGSVSGTASLTVTSAVLTAIQINPLSPSLVLGGSEQFSATAIYSNGTSSNATASVTWTSSASTVATMSTSTSGLAASIGIGETTISASWGAVTDSTTLIVQDQLDSIAITPSTPLVPIGDTQQLAATGTYASGITQDLTNSVSWSSSASGVATVSASGLATALTLGQTNIGASLGNVTGSASLTVSATDPLGTGSATTISCPSGSSIGGTCYAVVLSCPNINDFTGYIKVTYPTGTPVGTVLFLGGGTGDSLYEDFTYGDTLLNDVLQDGFTIAQISWGQPFTTTQPNGWQTGPGGIRAVACRFATLAQWIYTNLASTTAPFCATGNSGGAELIGQALAHYGMASIFVFVEPTSGPTFTRLDWACDDSQPTTPMLCGGTQGFELPFSAAENYVDPAYPGPWCSQELTTKTTTYDATFLHDSVLAPDATTLNYPNTFVNFVYGDADTTTSENQAHLWASSITSSETEVCVPNTGHAIADSLEGAQQIANDIQNYCKLP